MFEKRRESNVLEIHEKKIEKKNVLENENIVKQNETLKA
jgi:hypothetical protein